MTIYGIMYKVDKTRYLLNKSILGKSDSNKLKVPSLKAIAAITYMIYTQSKCIFKLVRVTFDMSAILGFL